MKGTENKICLPGKNTKFRAQHTALLVSSILDQTKKSRGKEFFWRTLCRIMTVLRDLWSGSWHGRTLLNCTFLTILALRKKWPTRNFILSPAKIILQRYFFNIKEYFPPNHLEWNAFQMFLNISSNPDWWLLWYFFSGKNQGISKYLKINMFSSC